MSTLPGKKLVRQIRIAEQLDRDLTIESENTGKTKTLIIEEALMQYLYSDRETERQELVESIMKAMDEKYSNVLTRIRLGTRTAEQNSVVLLDLANSMLHLNGVDEYAFTSERSQPHPMIRKSKDGIREMISNSKQKKDNE